MDLFNYRENMLHCEQVPVQSIAERYGTPLYVYSYNTIVRHFTRTIEAWKPFDVNVAYSIKANSNIAILSILRKLGGYVDAVSKGEIYRALHAGFPPQKIVFGGVGKTREELEYAIEKKIDMIVADSYDELARIDSIAGKCGKKVRAAVRVNPDIDPKTHPYISTALKESKFGVPMKDAVKTYTAGSTLRHVALVGLQQHIGSQIVTLEPYLEALRKLKRLIVSLRKKDIPISSLDIGGGIGITYKEEEPFSLETFAGRIISLVKDLGCRIILEPGRVIVGNAGILVTKVLYLKKGPTKHFVIADAGMNDLIRPSLYDAYHKIVPVVKTPEAADAVDGVEGVEDAVGCISESQENVSSSKFLQTDGDGFPREQKGMVYGDLVGPICESGDFFARDRSIPEVAPGGYLALLSAGAYGFSMASNYNSRPRPAEILVSGKRAYVIRKRETDQDLIRGESIPGFLA